MSFRLLNSLVRKLEAGPSKVGVCPLVRAGGQGMKKALYGASEDKEGVTARKQYQGVAWHGKLNSKQSEDSIHAGGEQPQSDLKAGGRLLGRGEGRVHRQDTGCMWHWPKNRRHISFWPCHTACRISVPQQRIKLRSSAVKAPSLNSWSEFPKETQFLLLEIQGWTHGKGGS